MASYQLPAPGTDLGPCSSQCVHADCLHTRFQANMKCVTCDEKIGYEGPFFYLSGDRMQHVSCAVLSDWSERENRSQENEQD